MVVKQETPVAEKKVDVLSLGPCFSPQAIFILSRKKLMTSNGFQSSSQNIYNLPGTSKENCRENLNFFFTSLQQRGRTIPPWASFRCPRKSPIFFCFFTLNLKVLRVHHPPTTPILRKLLNRISIKHALTDNLLNLLIHSIHNHDKKSQYAIIKTQKARTVWLLRHAESESASRQLWCKFARFGAFFGLLVALPFLLCATVNDDPFRRMRLSRTQFCRSDPSAQRGA